MAEDPEVKNTDVKNIKPSKVRQYQQLRGTGMTSPVSRRSSSGRITIPTSVVMTGATGTIGRAIIKEIVKIPGVRVHLVVRPESKTKAAELVSELEKSKELGCEITVHYCDLASKKSIQSFIESLKKTQTSLDILLNCAATAPKERTTATEDNAEMQFVVNVLSYHRLIKGLLPILNQSDRKNGGRVINMAAKDANHLDVKDLMFRTRTYDPQMAHLQSKAAIRCLTAMYEKQWGSTYKNVNFYCLHPGEVVSDLTKVFGLKRGTNTPAECADTALYLINEQKIGKEKSGTYWVSKNQSVCRFATHADRDLLWETVEKLA